MNTNPKYRRPLNPNQINTLLFLFKFRFISSHLLSAAFGNKSRRTVQQTLQILEAQGFIAKHYDSSYKLQGRQATYYLLPKAVRELKARYSLNESILRTYLRNSSLSEGFIDHHLDIVKTYINLKNSYPKQFHIFTKYELADFDYFPNQKPDIYLRRIKGNHNKPNEYLLDIYEDTPLFVIRRRVDGLINHFEANEWAGAYPILLFACPDSKAENRILNFALKKLDGSELTELSIYTTTGKALLSTSSSKNIWSNIENPEQLLIL
jgi:hypothetical protein